MEDPLGVDIGRDEALTVIPIRGGYMSLGTFWAGEKPYTVITKAAEDRSNNQDKIIGTVQIKDDKVSLTPSLVISTASGDVVIRLDEIVNF
jgi:hypothetical protein